MRLVVLVPAGNDREGEAAAEWARAGGYDLQQQSLGRGGAPVLTTDDVVWCHAGTRVPLLPQEWQVCLEKWVESGGRLLLSLLATPLAAHLGAPYEWPNVSLPAPWHDADDSLWPEDFRTWPDFPHIRGAQGWGEHPLFDGLLRGTFTWSAREGEPVARVVLARGPTATSARKARIIAVDRAYVQLDAGAAVAWECDVGRGRILCLGANLSFTAADRRLVAQRDRYLVNALAYLDPRRDARLARRAWWPSASAVDVLPVGLPPRPLQMVGPRLRPALTLSGPPRDAAAVSLAGRAALVVGDERRGVEEIWLHPLCAISGGFVATVNGVPLRATAVQVAPATLERQLADATAGEWSEVVTVSPDRPAAFYQLAPGSGAQLREATVEVSLRLRLQWPYPSDALYPLSTVVERDGARASVVVSGADPRMAMAIYIDGAAALTVGASPTGPRLTITSAPGTALRLAVVATTEGMEALAAESRLLGEGILAEVLERQRTRLDRLMAGTVSVSTPSPSFDTAWGWAKARLASFVARVPGIGTGLMAGFAPTRPGWGDSRPGYAWFFGRDACWTGDALLAAGLFEEARCALEFLAQTSDVTGKIAHEITTSGVAHYDAADATPLFLRFVAAYAEWTGDLSTIRAHWAEVRAAVAFVLSHDTDGDGLPENTGVGHGWVESGPLGGGALTSYTASIWIDALRRLAPVAALLRDDDLRERLEHTLHQAVSSFERKLRDPSTGRVYLQLHADGTPVRDLTALSAVPIALGVDARASAEAVMAKLSSDEFSAPWGVRMIGTQDARYRPRGYHCGAAWPLCTGWAALANFALGRPEAGWSHLESNAGCALQRSRGAFDEVLDGDTGGGAGICSDQAWSAAMVISPFIFGMLGMRPSASARRCIIDPRWPAAWTHARAERLRVGGSVFSLEMVAVAKEHRYTLRLDEGAPLEVRIGTALHGESITLVEGHAVTIVRRSASASTPSAQGDPHGRR